MTEDVDVSTSANVSPATMHKGSGFAVHNGNMHWYIAECKPTKESTIRTMLQNAKFEVFVASRTETKIYANRTRRTKEHILIPGKVFVRTTEDQLMPIMRGYSSVWRFMINRLSKGRGYAYVPEDEMQQLQYVLGHAENPVHITAEDLKVNQKVMVTRGALTGFEGYFLKQGHTAYIVIKVSMGTNHYAYTEVPLEDIQLL